MKPIQFQMKSSQLRMDPNPIMSTANESNTKLIQLQMVTKYIELQVEYSQLQSIPNQIKPTTNWDITLFRITTNISNTTTNSIKIKPTTKRNNPNLDNYKALLIRTTSRILGTIRSWPNEIWVNNFGKFLNRGQCARDQTRTEGSEFIHEPKKFISPPPKQFLPPTKLSPHLTSPHQPNSSQTNSSQLQKNFGQLVLMKKCYVSVLKLGQQQMDPTQSSQPQMNSRQLQMVNQIR